MRTNTSADRRRFLRRLIGLVAGLSVVGVGGCLAVGGCGTNEQSKGTVPAKRLPPGPGKKQK